MNRGSSAAGAGARTSSSAAIAVPLIAAKRCGSSQRSAADREVRDPFMGRKHRHISMNQYPVLNSGGSLTAENAENAENSRYPRSRRSPRLNLGYGIRD